MVDRIRQIAQRLKDKVPMSQLNSLNIQGKDKVDQLVAKYVPAEKVSEIAEKFKQENVVNRMKDLVSKYEKFTGVEEIMAIQNTVIAAQERFIAAQDQRRDLSRQVGKIEARLKELHAEMQNTMKGDEKYLQLCTEEHKLIIQDRAIRQLFYDAEREERELFATMSAAVKLGHERERAHAERNKYWYIVASILGTVLGIAGSTINNRLKMAEFRDMMEEQMARSASVLYTVAGGGSASKSDITDAMKTEFAYQEQLAHNLKVMQENVNHLVTKQSSLIEHLNHHEHNIDNQLRDLKRLMIATSQNSAKSDQELTRALNLVHQDLDEAEKEHMIKEYMGKDHNVGKDRVESDSFIHRIGVTTVIVFIAGIVIGKITQL